LEVFLEEREIDIHELEVFRGAEGLSHFKFLYGNHDEPVGVPLHVSRRVLGILGEPDVEVYCREVVLMVEVEVKAFDFVASLSFVLLRVGDGVAVGIILAAVEREEERLVGGGSHGQEKVPECTGSVKFVLDCRILLINVGEVNSIDVSKATNELGMVGNCFAGHCLVFAVTDGREKSKDDVVPVPPGVGSKQGFEIGPAASDFGFRDFNVNSADGAGFRAGLVILLGAVVESIIVTSGRAGKATRSLGSGAASASVDVSMVAGVRSLRTVASVETDTLFERLGVDPGLEGPLAVAGAVGVDGGGVREREPEQTIMGVGEGMRVFSWSFGQGCVSRGVGMNEW
jgi:hypothetical protein